LPTDPYSSRGNRHIPGLQLKRENISVLIVFREFDRYDCVSAFLERVTRSGETFVFVVEDMQFKKRSNVNEEKYPVSQRASSL
jgi:hypothetical protein